MLHHHPWLIARLTLIVGTTSLACAPTPLKPNLRYANVAFVSPISPIPTSVNAALPDPNWRAAMQAEFDALTANQTWQLVPRPAGAHIVSDKWIFRHKFKEDDTLEWYKARWVVRGFTQRTGVEYGDTLCLVIKSATLRTVLTLVAHVNGQSTNST